MAAKKKKKRKSPASKTKKRASRRAKPTKGAVQSSPRWGLVGAVGVVAVVGGIFLYSQRSDAEGVVNTTDIEAVETVDLTEPSSITTVPEALMLRVVTRHPHDPRAFTQGLLWNDGVLYESTGLEGRSSLRRVNLDGTVVQRQDVDEQYFAEGLALVNDEFYQLTWQDNVVFVYDRQTLEPKREMPYEGEGWGLCWNGTNLVMSDGSSTLSFRDPETFDVRREVRVTKIGRPVRYLNELECVDGVVYANIWQRDEIVRIDPASGRVTASIDASGLLTPEERRNTDVLNGIAWMPDQERFLVTGKLWPWTFEVELVPR